MNQPDTTSVQPFKRLDDEPIFDEAWQPQLLAMVDQMMANGAFTNSQWSALLGQNLKEAEEMVDDMDNYYAAVLKTFETLLAGSADVSQQSITQTQKDWEQAYLNTPHGEPVILKR